MRHGKPLADDLIALHVHNDAAIGAPVTPSEQARPTMPESMAEHGQTPFPDVVGHGQEGVANTIVEPLAPDEPTWPVAVEESNESRGPVEIIAEQPEAPAAEAPPETADLVTVEEAVEIFRERGLPRHMRTIQKYCSHKTERVLESYQVPTENGIRYMIERSSIDRFVGDAAMQAPTGKLENETIAKPISREQAKIEQGRAPMVDQLDIFEHPPVKRLEGQVERLESRNEASPRMCLNRPMSALWSCKKATAVAQSERLGKFQLESERIRGGQAGRIRPSKITQGFSIKLEGTWGAGHHLWRWLFRVYALPGVIASNSLSTAVKAILDDLGIM